MHNRTIEIIRKYFPLLLVAGVLLVAFPRTSSFPYKYKKGSVWNSETLVSQFDFPILKTQEQILREMNDSKQVAVPYYKFSDEIVERNLKDFDSFSLDVLEPYRSVLRSSLRDIYDRGIIADSGVRVDKNSDSAESELIFIQKDKRAMKYPASEIFKLAEARAQLLKDLSGVSNLPGLDSLLRVTRVYELLAANLVYDQQTTELVARETEKDISPTDGFVASGQLIVSKGEVVTADIAQILDSYKREYNASIGYSRAKVFLWIAEVLMALLLVLLLHCSMFFLDTSLLADRRNYLFILTIFTFLSLSSLVLIKTNVQNYLYMVPFTVTAMWLRAFNSKDVSIAVYALGLLPMLVFAHSGVPLFFIYLIGGGVTIILYDRMCRGWKQFLMAIIVFAAMCTAYCSLRLLDIATGNAVISVVSLLVSSLLSIAIYPLVYLFERIFRLVSNFRLTELADTSNTLLRELEKKAPGTFQHSLQVANMADAAARAIGANHLLLRVGALYHDLGKMNNPQCFVENESLVKNDSDSKYHDTISPEQSAADITRHVTDGMEIAVKHHIPEIVRDFISSHHGTSCVSYFYDKYLNEGGDPARKADFEYKGRKPVSREQVILMICDSVEAASRTLKEFTADSYSDFVENIVSGKLDQLDESLISIKDLNTVKSVLKNYLAQVYHERVEYPNRNQS